MSVIFINPYRFGFSYDVDAAAYIARVEGASGDNQALEDAVKTAINDFVIGCKADGIWTAIKASCILAGARTLAGALQPLVGTAPTNFNFVSGDYNRKTGLKGNGSNKYLDCNRANTADPRDNKHISIYETQAHVSGGQFPNLFGAGDNGSGGQAMQILLGSTGDTSKYARINTDGYPGLAGARSTLGFHGGSRNGASSSTIVIGGGAVIAFSDASVTPLTSTIYAYRGVRGFYTDARFAFYSIGESLDLALLSTRVTSLINAYAAAIP